MYSQGRVILIASEAGVRIIPAMLHYSVSKTAQIGLAQGLAQLAKGTRVTVNSVVVGPTWTEGVDEPLWDESTWLTHVARCCCCHTSLTESTVEFWRAQERIHTFLLRAAAAHLQDPHLSRPLADCRGTEATAQLTNNERTSLLQRILGLGH